MRKFIVVMIILSTVFLSLPYFIGRVAESAIIEFAENSRANQFGIGEIDIKQYQRSFASSKFNLSWVVPDEYAALFIEPLKLECEGAHGALSYRFSCKMENLPQYNNFVEQHLQNNDPLLIGGEITALGNVRQKLELMPFSFMTEKGAMVNVKKGELIVATDQDFQHFKINGYFNGLTIGGKDRAQFVVHRTQLEGRFVRNIHSLMVGDLKMRMQGFDLTSSNGDEVTLDGMEVVSRGSEQGASMTIQHSINVDRVTQADTVSPTTNADTEFSQSSPKSQDVPFEMKNLHAMLTVSGVNTETLAKFYKQVQEMAKADARASASGQNDANRDMLRLTMLPTIEALLAKGLVLSIEGSANYVVNDSDLPLRANLDIELLDQLSLSDSILLSVQPEALLRKFKVTMASEVPTKFAKERQSANRIDWFEQQGERYVLDFSAGPDNIKLNSQTMSAEEFIDLVKRQK